MRMRRIIIGSALVALFVVALFTVPYCLFNADYLKFKHKNAKYHADFAEACNSILMHHPLGTNEAMELSVTDPSLPRIISDLHPKKIGLSHNKVWIGVHDGHIGGLAIIWETLWVPQDQTQTNAWTLSINDGEGQKDTVYVGNR